MTLIISSKGRGRKEKEKAASEESGEKECVRTGKYRAPPRDSPGLSPTHQERSMRKACWLLKGEPKQIYFFSKT